jgi:hypothetical protein
MRTYLMPILAVCFLVVFLLVDYLVYRTGWTWTFSEWMDVWGLANPWVVVGWISGGILAVLVLAWHFWVQKPQPPFSPPGKDEPESG